MHADGSPDAIAFKLRRGTKANHPRRRVSVWKARRGSRTASLLIGGRARGRRTGAEKHLESGPARERLLAGQQES